MYMITVWYESIHMKNKKWIKLDRNFTCTNYAYIYIYVVFILLDSIRHESNRYEIKNSICLV